MISGRSASPRAMPMRWRWPPENWCGYRLMYSGLRPTTSSRSSTRRRRSPLGATSGWMSKGSPMMSPTVIRGLSEVYGSWKTIWMLRRTAFSARPDSFVMSSPL